MKRVGVVIVNYINYLETVRYVKDFLSIQENVLLDIVIVENASPNDSYLELCNSFSGYINVSVIRQKINVGYAIGNNIGIAFLEDRDVEYILVSNSDILLDDKLLIYKLTKRYLTLSYPALISPIMIVGGKVSAEFSAWRLPSIYKEMFVGSYVLKILFKRFLKKYHYTINYGSREALLVDCVPGSFFLFKKELMKEIGYLDEGTFLYYEETILGNKIKKKGLKNYIIQDLRYSHIESSSINSAMSAIRKHKILLASKIYYWRKFGGANSYQLLILKLLFIVWKIEFLVINILRRN